MDQRWQIELLGGLRATRHQQVVTRFRTRKTGAWLAYLACHRDCSHPREVLIELLWPESDPKSGRNRLNLARASLRRQLESPGVPQGAVIVADSASVQLNPAACVTDVARFEAARQVAARAGSSTEKEARLIEAVELHRGELLPGYFEEWILPERQRLAERYLQAYLQLVTSLEQAGDLTSRSPDPAPVRMRRARRAPRAIRASGPPWTGVISFSPPSCSASSPGSPSSAAASRWRQRRLYVGMKRCSGVQVLGPASPEHLNT
jgi:hypothetical protein